MAELSPCLRARGPCAFNPAGGRKLPESPVLTAFARFAELRGSWNIAARAIKSLFNSRSKEAVLSRETIGLSDRLMSYVRTIGAREDADLARLREETAKHPRAQMQISLEQGQFLALLIELIGAQRTVEVGTFTGYSAMWVAKAMGPSGRVVALDVDKDFTAVALRHWKQAGVDSQIDLRLAPAANSLRKMLDDGEAGRYDFAFIDADKTNYDTYFELCVQLLRKGGLMAIDNVLWSGRVADPTEHGEDTVALRNLNAKIAKDERVTVSLVPIGDGLTLARKR